MAEESEEEAIEDSGASLKPVEPTRNWWKAVAGSIPSPSRDRSRIGGAPGEIDIPTPLRTNADWCDVVSVGQRAPGSKKIDDDLEAIVLVTAERVHVRMRVT